MFFIALAVMCLAGTGALCTIQPPPSSAHLQGETATLSPRHSALGIPSDVCQNKLDSIESVVSNPGLT